jgi:hypothetical protein
MIKKSWLTTVIGFLIGCVMYLTIESSTLIVFISGGVGYFLGLILDSADIKDQMETFHFTSIPPTQQLFQVNDIPEAHIMYSLKENMTSVVIDFRVDIKPQNFHLSVLKNLQDYEFRVIEDANKTIFSLSLEYPECNYPNLLSTNQTDSLHFDIRERSHDFQGALQKIVPGLVLNPILYPDLFGDELDQYLQPPSSSPSKPSPPRTDSKRIFSDLSDDNSAVSSYSFGFNRKTISQELIDYPSKPDVEETSQNLINPLNRSESEKNPDMLQNKDSIDEGSGVDESEIMNDLLKSSQTVNETATESETPHVSPEDVQKLKDVNLKNFGIFLNEDYSISPPSLSSRSGLLSADKIASMAEDIPTDKDTPNSTHSIDDMAPKKTDTSSPDDKSVKLKLESDNEETDNQDTYSVKIDYSSLFSSENEMKKEPKLNDFNMGFIGRIDKYMRTTTDTSEIKQEIKNVRKALHEESVSEQET